MLFGTHARLSDADFGVTFKGRPIKRVFEFKYSGVAFDEHFSWNSHFMYVLSRAGKGQQMFARIRWNLTSACAYSIYTAYIRPIVTPCGIVAVLATFLLERLQRRDAKIVPNMSDGDKAVGYLN